jgi:hypothetical protein
MSILYNISFETVIADIRRRQLKPEDGGSKFLRNADNHLSNYID